MTEAQKTLIEKYNALTYAISAAEDGCNPENATPEGRADNFKSSAEMRTELIDIGTQLIKDGLTLVDGNWS